MIINGAKDYVNFSRLYNILIIIDRDIDIPNHMARILDVIVLAGDAALLPTPPVALGNDVAIAPPLGRIPVLKV